MKMETLCRTFQAILMLTQVCGSMSPYKAYPKGYDGPSECELHNAEK